MIRYVPPFILSQFENNNYQGEMQAFVLLGDIIGFTTINDELQKKGKEGAEEVSHIIRSIFTEPINIIERFGGFISNFAGDAFYSIFPNNSPAQFCAALYYIQSFLKTYYKNQSHPSQYPFKMRIRIGYGNVKWRIFTNEIQNEYVFFGDAIEEVQHINRGQTLCKYSFSALQKLTASGYMDDKGKINQDFKPEKVKEKIISYPYGKETEYKFLHHRFHNIQPENEIRTVICNYTRIPLTSDLDYLNIIAKLENFYQHSGFYVDKLCVTKDFLCILSFYGMPRNEGKRLSQVFQQILECEYKYPFISEGIAMGSCFTGFIGGEHIREYTALGHSVNLAARLSEKSINGEILTDSAIRKELKMNFDFEFRGNLTLKGLKNKISTYKLKELQSPNNQFKKVFIGRQNQLKNIQNIIVRSFNEHHNFIVYIAGEAGIGKTSLTAEVLNSLQGKKIRVFNILCSFANPRPMDPLIQIFSQLFPVNYNNQKTISSFHQSWINWIKNEKGWKQDEDIISGLLGYADKESLFYNLPPDLRFNKIYQSAVKVLQKETKRNPIIIYIDDLHWMETQPRNFFQCLGKSEIKDLGIIATTRYLENDKIPTLDMDNFSFYRLDLAPLSKNYSWKLYKSLMNLGNVSTDLKQELLKRDTGNPFIIEQMASYLFESGILHKYDDFKNIFEKINSFDVNDIIGFRIDRLSASVRECIYNASVLGMKFNLKVLNLMLERDIQQDLLIGTQNRIWKSLEKDFYIFTHILLQEAAYNRMLSDKLKCLHLKAAQAIEKVYEQNIRPYTEEIAHHYENAGEILKASDFYDEAGDYYWDNSYFEVAEKCFLKAIDLAEKSVGSDNMDYGEKIFHLALFYHYMQRMEEAEKLYNTVMNIALFTYGKDSIEISPYINNLGRYYKDVGRYEESEKLLLQSLELEKKYNADSSNVADRINNLGHLYSLQHFNDKAREMCQQAYDIMTRNYDPYHFFTATVCNNLGMTLVESGKIEEGEELLLKAIEIGKKVYGENQPQIVIYFKNLASIYIEQQKWDEAKALLQKCLHINQKYFGKYHSSTLYVVKALERFYDKIGNKRKANYYANWLQESKKNKL